MFPEGASATSHAGGIVLTTRLAPSDLGAASVTWAVARDRRMRDVVAGGRTAAGAADGWTVRVDASAPGAAGTYWFQFRALGVTSAAGRIDVGVNDASA